MRKLGYGAWSGKGMYAVDPAQNWGQLAMGTPAPPQSWGQDSTTTPWGQSAFFVQSLTEVFPTLQASPTVQSNFKHEAFSTMQDGPTLQESFKAPKKTSKMKMPKFVKPKVTTQNKFGIFNYDGE